MVRALYGVGFDVAEEAGSKKPEQPFFVPPLFLELQIPNFICNKLMNATCVQLLPGDCETDQRLNWG